MSKKLEIIYTLNIITVLYKGQEVFKIAEQNGDDSYISSSPHRTIPFTMEEADKEFAENLGVVYDEEINADGFEELNRLLSYLDDCDFFEVKFETRIVEV